MNISILGATSHIAKGLIDQFLDMDRHHLYLFTRSEERINQFLRSINKIGNKRYDILTDYDLFSSFSFDVIINCIGVETRNRSNCDFTRYFSVTEEFDNMIIEYLKHINPDALYISFSSGAVYGRGFAEPVNEYSVNSININHVVPEDYYGIVRINAEAKHRSNLALRIIDLRVFSYFSRFITLTDGYFITDVIQAIINNNVLITDDRNIIRDYLNPKDLFVLILKCIDAGRLNLAFDVVSLCPVAKQEILDYFSLEYNLKYEVRNTSLNSSATGLKSNYFSKYSQTSKINYVPQFTSLETIKLESEHILSKNKNDKMLLL